MNDKMDRRGFLRGMAGASAGAALAGCVSGAVGGRFDDALSVFISDLHVGGVNHDYDYTQARLARVVDEILAMRPLPRRVVCFGDVGLTYGLPEDYVVSKPILTRLAEAGIDLHLTMGNHDRRSAFLAQWPEYAKNQLVPGRFTRVLSLGDADLVLLDTLKGTDTRALDDMGPVEGTVDPGQLKWFDAFVAQAKRPFFVGSHQFRDLYIPNVRRPISRAAASPFFVGWIYGHDHTWCPSMAVASWGKNQIYPVLALPSTGLWGDIGYALVRTDPDGATVSLVQRDFYFQKPTAFATRPRQWDARLRDNQDKSLRFLF